MYLNLSSNVLSLGYKFEAVLPGLSRNETHVLLRGRF